MTQLNTKSILVLKTQVQKVYDHLVKLQKKFKKTKKSNKALKLMEKFLNCHLSCPTILQKYEDVVSLMEEYAKDVDNIR